MGLSFNAILAAVFVASAFAAPPAGFRHRCHLDYQDYPNGHLRYIEPSRPMITNSNTAVSDSPRTGGSRQVVPARHFAMIEMVSLSLHHYTIRWFRWSQLTFLGKY